MVNAFGERNARKTNGLFMTKGKTVSENRVVMSYFTLPQDANPAGNIHGGVILKHIDECAAMVAMRHIRGNAVTASIDRVDFLRPVFIGELVTFKASLNLVGKTSMEIGVRVEAENLFTGEVRHTASAYLTYVALDKDHKPTGVPPLILETDEDKRRNIEAQRRREARIFERRRERTSQEDAQTPGSQ